MPPKDSATEMLYKILDDIAGIGITYDAKTNTIYTAEPKTAIYDKVTAVDKCYVSCATDHKCSQCENWKEKEEETKMKNETKPALVYGPFAVRSVLSNRKKNAFSVVWMDGTTTVVHCQAGDDWDDEKALAMCFTKKALGNKGNFNNKFNDALDNKMKIIPAEPAPKKACNCDGTCTECKCKEESKSAKIYKIFLCSASTGEKKMHLATCYSAQEVRDFVKEYGKEAGHGWYFRTWNADGGMYIDYGSYTNYLFVEGMHNSEYGVKKC